MQTGDEYPICPKCRRPIVDLARFDARDATISMEQDPNQSDWDYDTNDKIFNWISDKIDYFMAGRKQRKLDAVLKDYPNSLYCAGCGYLVKRR